MLRDEPKWNPPLLTARTLKRCAKRSRRTIDLIATDHAPLHDYKIASSPTPQRHLGWKQLCRVVTTS